MAKLIAIHLVMLAGAVAGVADEIQPGHAFEASDEEAKFLAERGAARPATEDDKGAKVAQRSVSSVVATVKQDLSKLKKADLIALAASEEIAIDESATIPVIIAAIEAAREAAGQDDLV